MFELLERRKAKVDEFFSSWNLGKQKLTNVTKTKMKSSTIFTWMHVLLMGIVFLTFLIGEIEGGIKAGGKFDFKQRKNN